MTQLTELQLFPKLYFGLKSMIQLNEHLMSVIVTNWKHSNFQNGKINKLSMYILYILKKSHISKFFMIYD